METTNQHKVKAWTISIILHAILLAFMFLFVLRTPNPPFGAGQGVVLNLGYVDEGSGEVQTLNPASDNPNTEEIKNTEDLSSQQNPTEQPLPDQNSNENLITGTEESEVKTEENKDGNIEPTTETKPTKEVEKVTKTETNSKITSENNKSTSINSSTNTKGTANNGGNNNGDKTGKIGDQGNPNGDINAKALYGNQGEGGNGAGGKGGASLDMAGWRWEKLPKVNDDNEDENGKLVFQITIDQDGEIISIKTLQKTVSPTVEKLYRQEVEKLTFSKTDGKIPPSTSTGTITFLIKSK